MKRPQPVFSRSNVAPCRRLMRRTIARRPGRNFGIAHFAAIHLIVAIEDAASFGRLESSPVSVCRRRCAGGPVMDMHRRWPRYGAGRFLDQIFPQALEQADAAEHRRQSGVESCIQADPLFFCAESEF